MKALTVQQPWAWAIFNGKDIENRVTLWKHRGPLAIHAGTRWSQRGEESPLVVEAFAEMLEQAQPRAWGGEKLLVDTHHCTPICCDSPWAEQRYVQHNGEPIPCRGALGLWTVPDHIVDAINDDHAEASWWA